MRLTTWNVNGIRNPFGYAPWNATRTYSSMFDILQSDIVVMQELKIQRKDLRDDMVLIDGWDCYFSLPRAKKGYSGVGIYTRNATCAPIKAEEGVLGVLSPPGTSTKYRDLPDSQAIGGYPSVTQIADLGVDPELLDSEGRCVCLEFPAFVLFGVYCPANSNGLRDDFRYGFMCALDCRIRNLVKAGKHVVLVGDVNVSRDENDTAGGEEDRIKEGKSHAEYISTPNRRIFNQMVIGGEVVGPRDEGREEAIMWDIVREHHPDRKGMYTHWEQKVNARPGNYGSRIDFVLVSKAMKDWICEADIQEGLMGSDHCPVYSTFNDMIPFQTATGELERRNMLDVMNPPGYFQDGQRVTQWSIKNIPAFSGKLLAEFSRRNNIVDMFTKRAKATPSSADDRSHGSTAVQSKGSQATPATTDASPKKHVGESFTSQASPSTKRKPSTTTTTPRELKRQKSSSNSTVSKTSKSATANGQRGLMGYFTPKTGSTPSDTTTMESSKQVDSVQETHADAEIACSTQPEVVSAAGIVAISDDPYPDRGFKDLARDHSGTPSPQKLARLPPPSPGTSTDGSVHDPIVAKDSWSKLMAKPAAPICEHGEPCKTMLTKKKGENQGRSFFMCVRPLGPSGAKEKNTQWRCATFIWCSDFKK